MPLRILFSEGSSLTAREFLNVLGPRGHWIEIADSNPLCICRFSRWTRRVHSCPPSGSDSAGYVAAVNRLIAREGFDVLLPTHEQAWLFAVAGATLDPAAAVALAPAEAFARVQSKVAFAELLDSIGLPQPRWAIVDSPDALARWQPPYYLKTPFSTAGSGVRHVKHANEAVTAFRYLIEAYPGQPIMAQASAEGRYAQVQALFDHGRLVAAHTSVQTAVGIGPSAAGRESVDHPLARQDAARLGAHLNWHGGLTLDYLFSGQEPVYIECNPRTVEPGNAVASGVDLPGLQLALSLDEHPAEVPPGRTGIRTHSGMAIFLGTALYTGTRRAILQDLLGLLQHRTPGPDSREVLTPVLHDLRSALVLLTVVFRILLSPRAAASLSGSAIRAYAVGPEAIERFKGG
ncbi:MAG TPA: hypothetical protein VMC79_02110 [Rectinemataceae bacterium]|nr:hypothetical protein [Rectinemataceae bacterium]